MWFLRVLVNLHKFLALAGRADRYFRHHRPDAVVLIDYPGFNWWIARRAKAHGIPVFYLRAAADLGLGALADQEDAAVRRSRAVQPAVRSPLVRRARLQRHVRRPSLLRRAVRRSDWTKLSCGSTRPRPPAGDDPARLADAGGRAQPAVFPARGQADSRRRCRTCGSPWPASSRTRRRSRASGGGQRAADRSVRPPHARTDPAGRLLPGGVGLGVAGTAVSHASRR